MDDFKQLAVTALFFSTIILVFMLLEDRVGLPYDFEKFREDVVFFLVPFLGFFGLYSVAWAIGWDQRRLVERKCATCGQTVSIPRIESNCLDCRLNASESLDN